LHVGLALDFVIVYLFRFTIRYGRLTCAQKLTGWPA